MSDFQLVSVLGMRIILQRNQIWLSIRNSGILRKQTKTAAKHHKHVRVRFGNIYLFLSTDLLPYVWKLNVSDNAM